MNKNQSTNLSYVKVLKEKFLGKSMYPGFQRRMIASLIDCTLAAILLMPLFNLISSLIHGGVLPQEIMAKILKEITTIKETTGKTVDFRDFVKENSDFYNYFYTNHGFAKMFLDQIIELIIFCGIILTFWIKKQSTPGKMFLNMKIVDAKTLDKPSKKQFFLRMFGYFISTLPLFLGILWIIFDKKKQAWHDKISGTLVINVDKKSKSNG